MDLLKESSNLRRFHGLTGGASKYQGYQNNAVSTSPISSPRNRGGANNNNVYKVVDDELTRLMKQTGDISIRRKVCDTGISLKEYDQFCQPVNLPRVPEPLPINSRISELRSALVDDEIESKESIPTSHAALHMNTTQKCAVAGKFKVTNDSCFLTPRKQGSKDSPAGALTFLSPRAPEVAKKRIAECQCLSSEVLIASGGEQRSAGQTGKPWRSFIPSHRLISPSLPQSRSHRAPYRPTRSASPWKQVQAPHRRRPSSKQGTRQRSSVCARASRTTSGAATSAAAASQSRPKLEMPFAAALP